MQIWSNFFILGASAVTAAVLVACGSGKQAYDNPNKVYRKTNQYLETRPVYSNAVASPNELSNLSAGRIELGRKLFRDRRLSAAGDKSCATCHDPDQAFTQTDRALPVDADPSKGDRNAPSLYDVISRKLLFHDGRATSLSAQAVQPLLNPREMGNASMATLAERIRTMPDYDRFFALAYGGPAQPETIASALSAYQLTLITGPNRFDLWKYRNRKAALNDAEIRGHDLFTGKAGCVACHLIGQTSASFTDEAFHDTGYAATKPPAFAKVDLGRFAVSQARQDMFAFRTPSLRNVALTSPYMHDGRLRTLEDVVAFFNVAQDLELSLAEQADIVAFLGALTSRRRP